MGLYFTKELKNGAQIAVWEITESEEELLDIISVPNEELEELFLIKGEARRKEKLAVRALLNTIFDSKVYLGYHDNGSPFIVNNPINISITHTNRFVGIITHPTEDVGIDIESLKRNFEVVEKRVLSEDEREHLSEKHKALQLAILWSAKEAMYKRMSEHGVDFSKQIIVDKFHAKDEGDLDATFINKEGESEEFELEYETFDEHIMVWLVG